MNVGNPAFLVEQEIDSLSLNPDAVLKIGSSVPCRTLTVRGRALAQLFGRSRRWFSREFRMIDIGTEPA